MLRDRQPSAVRHRVSKRVRTSGRIRGTPFHQVGFLGPGGPGHTESPTAVRINTDESASRLPPTIPAPPQRKDKLVAPFAVRLALTGRRIGRIRPSSPDRGAITE